MAGKNHHDFCNTLIQIQGSHFGFLSICESCMLSGIFRKARFKQVDLSYSFMNKARFFVSLSISAFSVALASHVGEK